MASSLERGVALHPSGIDIVKRAAWMICNSESVLLDSSTAVWVAKSASAEPSVASRIFVGKMLISSPS